MLIQELDFDYPESLVATERAERSRVLLCRHVANPEKDFEFQELTGGLTALVSYFERGDVLVINDTKVLRRRVFSEEGLEILFLESRDGEIEWKVLCPSTRWKAGTVQHLPDSVELELIAKGRPQTVRASKALTDDYFEKHGDLPLPPYIQKARNERRNRDQDKAQYQTAWAEKPGSLAAPTASLHFTEKDLAALRAKGVVIVRVTLHVGLGTFLPVTTENLNDHVMHAELAEIPRETWQAILEAKAHGRHIWALGTTVTRTLESAACGELEPVGDDVVCEHVLSPSPTGSSAFFGETHLFIKPGYQYQIIDRLLTNFHQPRSTLLALVGAFAGLQNVKKAYAFAIEKGFRLFSYGDLSVWMK